MYGEWRYSSTILDFSTTWWGVVSFITQLLNLWGKMLPVPTGQEAA
jgi:hypothetical protein